MRLLRKDLEKHCVGMQRNSPQVLRIFDLTENLIEEVYVQKDGYVATILWFEDEIQEK